MWAERLKGKRLINGWTGGHVHTYDLEEPHVRDRFEGCVAEDITFRKLDSSWIGLRESGDIALENGDRNEALQLYAAALEVAVNPKSGLEVLCRELPKSHIIATTLRIGSLLKLISSFILDPPHSIPLSGSGRKMAEVSIQDNNAYEPNIAAALCCVQLSDVLQKMERREEALAYAEKATWFWPEHMPPRTRVAQILRGLGREEEAVEIESQVREYQTQRRRQSNYVLAMLDVGLINKREAYEIYMPIREAVILSYISDKFGIQDPVKPGAQNMGSEQGRLASEKGGSVLDLGDFVERKNQEPLLPITLYAEIEEKRMEGTWGWSRERGDSNPMKKGEFRLHISMQFQTLGMSNARCDSTWTAVVGSFEYQLAQPIHEYKSSAGADSIIIENITNEIEEFISRLTTKHLNPKLLHTTVLSVPVGGKRESLMSRAHRHVQMRIKTRFPELKGLKVRRWRR
mmetsp:Transcript_13953/g.19364  ORF Transcript_13953/g.19364 Transcript_13953/m.19364 type:complete len:459 (-) Transcript_13953:542-1918(-)